MCRRHPFRPGLAANVCIASLLNLVGPALGQELRFSTAERIPEGCWAAVSVLRGAEQVSDLRKCEFLKGLQDAKGFQYFLSQPNLRQAQIGLALVPAFTGKDMWEIASLALGTEATLAVYFGDPGKPPPFLVVSIGADTRAVAAVLGKLHDIIGVTIGGEPDEDRCRMVAGTQVFEFDKGLRQAYVDGAIYLSNDDALIEQALRMRTTKNERSLATAGFWRTATRTAPKDAIIVAALDLGSWRKLAAPGGWPAKLPNPLATLLFRDWAARLGTADTWSATLHASADGLRIAARLHDARVNEKPSGRPANADGAGVFDLEDVRNGLAVLTLHRDLHRWWADREETMSVEAVGQLAQFAGVMSTLTGQDFDGELLPHVAEASQFIVARQTFDAGGPAPSPALPGFALVFRLKPGAAVGPRLDTAALMAMSFLNFDAGQKGQPQYEIAAQEHHGCKMLCATYPPRADDDARPTGIRYNFSPAFARAGEVAIIGTTREIVEDLIDAVKSDSLDRKGAVSKSDSFALDAGELMSVLRQNRDLFVSQRMLEADVSQREARRFVDALLDLGGLVRGVRITASAERGEASLQLDLSQARHERRKPRRL